MHVVHVGHALCCGGDARLDGFDALGERDLGSRSMGCAGMEERLRRDERREARGERREARMRIDECNGKLKIRVSIKVSKSGCRVAGAGCRVQEPPLHP